MHRVRNRPSLFRASLTSHGVTYTACAPTAEQAARKYNELAKQHHGDGTFLNKVPIPDEVQSRN